MRYQAGVWHQQPHIKNIIVSALRRASLSVLALEKLAEGVDCLANILILGTENLNDLNLLRRVEDLAALRPNLHIVVIIPKLHDNLCIQYYRAGAHLCFAATTSLHVLTTYVEKTLQQQDRAIPPITLDTLTVHPHSREVKLKDSNVPLRKREYDILHLLASHRGQALHRRTIHARTSEPHLLSDVSAVDVHICHIRRKLRLAGLGYNVIKTIPGYGYCIK